MGHTGYCLLVDWRLRARLATTDRSGRLAAEPTSSGMWDVMYRIEAAVWGQLRISQPSGPAAGGYFENMWLW